MCLVIATSVATAGCRPTNGLSRPDAPRGPSIPNAPAGGTDGSGRAQIRIDPDRSGGLLSIRLGESNVAATASVVTPLAVAETQALIKRLEPLPDLARTNAAAPP